MQPFSDKLIHLVVFPLLAISEEERQLFEDDAEEFNSLAEDCCDSQNFGLMKTETARLLEAVVDEYRGMDQYTIQHCIISIRVRVGLNDHFQPDAPHFLSLESAFLILSILSYRLAKFENELREINKVMVIAKIAAAGSHL